jgi:hypothetical protein
LAFRSGYAGRAIPRANEDQLQATVAHTEPAAANPAAADHRHHHQPAATRLGRHELAVLLQVKPRHMLTQLGEWSRLGFFTRTGFGTYRLNTLPATTSSTPEPDP